MRIDRAEPDEHVRMVPDSLGDPLVRHGDLFRSLDVAHVHETRAHRATAVLRRELVE